jgi:hypothetical protein
MINHRGPEFAATIERVIGRMKPYFGTTSDVAILSSAGTGGLEAAVVNVLSPGDRVLGVSIGSFGDRFAKIARTYGADVTKIEVEWGQAADPAALRAELEGEGRAGLPVVLLTHNGLDRVRTRSRCWPPRPRRRARRTDPRRHVSGLGAVQVEMDAWGIDVVVTGSQKAWMSAWAWPWSPRPSGLGGDGDGHDAAVLLTSGATATTTPTARRRGPRRSRSSSRSTRPGSWTARPRRASSPVTRRAAATGPASGIGFELFADLATRRGQTAASVPADLDGRRSTPRSGRRLVRPADRASSPV